MPSSRIHNNLPLESFSLLKVNYDVFNMLTNNQTRNYYYYYYYCLRKQSELIIFMKT